MSYDPYDYQRYANALKPPAGASYGSRTLPPRAGMSLAEFDEYRRIRERVEEVNRKQWYASVDGRLHSNTRDALDASLGAHEIWGLPDCASGNWRR